MASLVGTRLGKYEIRAEIGQGGMGTVYLGYDPLLDRRVAIKVLAPHLVWEKGFVERFLREARAAARLRHPNIVTIYDVGQEGSCYYFVMECLEGQTLAEAIRRRGALPLPEALSILRPLASALDYAHGQGVIHRDIKPGNVIVGPTQQVTLTDFGIARAADEARLTSTGTIVGTPEYMSPEQARGEEVDWHTDLYSLGAVAYEMLSGRVPFSGTTPHAVLHKQIYEPLPLIGQLRQGVPAGVEAVLGRALAKEPTARYGSTLAFVDALADAVAGGEETVHAVVGPVVGETVPVVTSAGEPSKTLMPAATQGDRSTPEAEATVRPQVLPTPVAGLPPRTGGQGRRRVPPLVWLLGGLAMAVLAAVIALVLVLAGGASPTPTPQPTLKVLVSTPSPPSPVLPSPTAMPAPSVPAQFRCADPIGCVEIGPDQPVHIGWMLVVSGPDSSLGIDAKRGIEIAIADRGGTLLGHPIELVGEDSQCSIDGGRAAAEKLSADPALLAVVGPSCSSEARGAIPPLCRAGIAMVSPSSTTPDLTARDRSANYWCFLRTAHNDQVQGLAMAQFAWEAGFRRAATIHDDSPYSASLQEVFAQSFKDLGGAVTTQELVSGGTELGPVLQRVAGTNPDLLFYPVFVEIGARITKLAKATPGLQGVQLAGADGLFEPGFLQAAGEAALGFLWSSPDLGMFDPRYVGFVEKYSTRYGQPPVSAFHAQAYDAASMVLAAIEKVAVMDPGGVLHIPRRALVDALLSTRGFQGLTGVLTCSPYGDCADPKLAVYQCENVDPASWNPGVCSDCNPKKIWP